MSEELEEWAAVVAQLHDGIRPESGDVRAAGHAVAMLWSGLGRLDAPMSAVELITKAIELGYLTALRDVREGHTEL